MNKVKKLTLFCSVLNDGYLLYYYGNIQVVISPCGKGMDVQRTFETSEAAERLSRLIFCQSN